MKHKTICAGIDRGFGVTKYYSDMVIGQIDSLVAPISPSRAKDLIANNVDDKRVVILKEGDKFYLIGSRVADVEPEYGSRNLDRHRNGLNERILFMTALGLCSGSAENVDFYVTTGLPTDEFEKNKKAYEDIIYNDGKNYVFSIIYEGKEYKKKISVKTVTVENQPKGTVITVLNDKLEKGEPWAELKSRKFAVCDVGYNTTDASVYVGKDIIGGGDKVNFSTSAMASIVADARNAIESAYDCKKSETDIMAALSTNKIKVKGKEVDVSEQISYALNSNADRIIEQTASKWDTYFDSFDEIILTGGAVANKAFSSVLRKKFTERFDWEVTVCENPQLANAFGFYAIACTVKNAMEESEEDE